MTKTDKSGQIIPRKTEPKLVSLLQSPSMRQGIESAIPSHLSPDRMLRIASTALRQTPALQQCTPMSFLGSVMQCAQLGLEPNTVLGQAFLIPYKDQCQLIIGYRGMIDLALRSGKVTRVYAHVVREGDTFRYSLGLHPELTHIPDDSPGRSRRKIPHAYAVAHIRDAEPSFEVLTIEDIESRRARSAAAKRSTSPWTTDFVAMARKSAIRALQPFIPQSPEMARAGGLDEAVELGRPQRFDPDVVGVLASQGVEDDGESLEQMPEAVADAMELVAKIKEPRDLDEIDFSQLDGVDIKWTNHLADAIASRKKELQK